MRIYLAHASDFDFKVKLYNPIRGSHLSSEHEFHLPQAQDDEVNTKAIIEQTDLFVIDASKPSTGAGIELGWADAFKKRIVCIYEKGSSPSASLQLVTNTFVEYENPETLISGLSSVIDQA